MTVVGRFGLGLAALGRPGYINVGHADDLDRDYEVAIMRGRAHAVLDAAWAAGIRYFDAARSYGRAEEFLVEWLESREIEPDAVTIGSKWGYTYTAGWRIDVASHEVKEHSIANLERQLGESRKLLGPHLDLYQIHSATLESGVLENRAILERLARLRDEGIAVGLSVTGPAQANSVRHALTLRIGGRRLFDSVQATWNVIEPSAGPALREAHVAGLRVIVKEGLANGRLTERGLALGLSSGDEPLREQAARLGCSVDALALAAVLAQPWADLVLSGAATVAHLHSNLGALSVRWDATAADALSSIREEPDAYWATRAALPWN